MENQIENISAELQAATLYVLGNKIIMDFCVTEATAKVAEDIRKKYDVKVNGDYVEKILLEGKDKTVQERHMTYIALGVAACAKERLEKQ